jgi:hypothetical protein
MTTTSKRFGGRLEFYDTATFERVLPVAPVTFYEDFLGAAFETIPLAGAAIGGDAFVKKIVGAGPPTVAGVSRAIAGQVQIALTATSEKQDAALYWDDNLGLDIAGGGLCFETCVALSVLPSAAGVQAVWGVAGPWIDGPNNNTCYAGFGCTANGALLIRAFDGVTTTSYATGITLSPGAFHTYRVNAQTLTDVRFYIDGIQVNLDNQVNFAAIGTLAVLQPYLACYKAAGVGLATMLVDYVRAWMNRA